MSFKKIKVVLLSSAFIPSVLFLSGCAESSQVTLLPQGGQTMEQVIKGQNGNIAPDNQDILGQGIAVSQTGVNVDSYTRTAMNETDVLLQSLPNYRLAGYIYPHVVGQGDSTTPVPGYTVPYWLYTTPQYALPGQ